MFSWKPIEKKKEQGTCISGISCTASVILTPQMTTFLRCTAGDSARSRSPAHSQPAAAGERSAGSAVLGVNAEHGKGRSRGCAKSLASSLLQPPCP